MSTPRPSEFAGEQETRRLHARIAELEDEISHIRSPGEGADYPEGLRENDLYKEAFDSISVCMFLVDVTADCRFRFAGFNPAEERAVGLTNAEVSGKFVEEVFNKDLSEKLVANYRRCLDAGKPINYDDELNLPSGRRYFHSNLIPIRNASGRIHRIVGACIETTDFKKAQDEALSRQKLESLGVLARGIAHDFNNLLGSILAQAELGQKELTLGSSPEQELQTIKRVAIRAGEIVRELMVYSGRDQASVGAVNLAELVEEMLELLRISISKHAKLLVDLPKNLPAVRANAVQIRQVVMNLITNASEALGDNEGVISVNITKIESGDSSSGGHLRLKVSDTGCGMTAEVQARIFDPFFTTKFAGRGLGLAAVQGIILGHRGSINVSSDSGQGTTFEVLLPCMNQPAEDTRDLAVPAPVRNPESRAGTVLMVEDEEILRTAVSKILRRDGFTVIEAGDGPSAVAVYRANESKIDVVLLDLTLPGLAGQDVLKQMRQIHPGVKVILASAFGQDRVQSAIGEQSLWGYVRKPYQSSELSSLLQTAVWTNKY